VHLPYDPEDPPPEPPPGSDPLVWRLAYGLHSDHQPDSYGWCVVCRPLTTWPCNSSRLSAVGFAAAVDSRTRHRPGPEA
jgi:hypothetical protein